MRSACRRPPRARQLGQRVQRLLRAAEMIDELAERDRADVVAADQAQARQALRGVERRLRQRCRRQPRAHAHDRAPILLSRPSSRRRMLA